MDNGRCTDIVYQNRSTIARAVQKGAISVVSDTKGNKDATHTDGGIWETKSVLAMSCSFTNNGISSGSKGVTV